MASAKPALGRSSMPAASSAMVCSIGSSCLVGLLGHSNGYYDLLLAHHRLGIVALHDPWVFNPLGSGGLSASFCLWPLLLPAVAPHALGQPWQAPTLPGPYLSGPSGTIPSPVGTRLDAGASIALASGAALHGWWPGPRWLPPSSHQEPLPPASPDPLHGITSVPLQRLLERLRALRPKATDGTEVWLPVCHHPESYIFLQSTGYAPGTAYTHAVAVQQDVG